VIEMQQDADAMKNYFTKEAWAKWKDRYEAWPSEEWRNLCRDVEARLADDPGSPDAQQIADRWIALFRLETGGDPAVYAGLWRVLVDRANWPATLQQRFADFDLDQIMKFIGDAAWIKGETEREKQRTIAPRAPDRVSPSRMTLFREIEAAVDEGPASEKARELAGRWLALAEYEAGGDPEIRSDLARAWVNRRRWPAGMRQYVASLYETDPDTWLRVTDFIESASRSLQ
jgi:TipAS antibiotic-recognition protein